MESSTGKHVIYAWFDTTHLVYVWLQDELYMDVYFGFNVVNIQFCISGLLIVK